MFIVGGFNAYPAEIEGLMLDHPDLAQVADRRRARRPHGRGRHGVRRAAVGPHRRRRRGARVVREHMANYKVPRHVEVVDELPLNASGKVLKFELRERGRAITGT